ncbi:cell wall hydrolase [Ancylobacter oerskovii]|uniref:Cell wall hydrolase n=1 Tax=Ancylobacter oerskovii TaxID=459519 RepID=A0ABW4YW94_9HYPH|nr:cell wall hydrolase [Ancylobacter oerskovii]MBS7542362.1 cell wall hydrolase [Ancylobacter oerskovii]
MKVSHRSVWTSRWQHWRRQRLIAGLALAGVVTPFLASGIGHQDIAALLTHNPGVVAKVRLDVLPGTFRTLKAATFAWPATSSLPPGSAIPSPPRLAPLAIDIDRSGKGDRLPGQEPAEPGLPDALAAAGTASLAAPAGTGTGSAPTAAGMGTGTGVGTALARSGTGTDPYEAGEDVADANDLAAYSGDAGDPTGDPTELENAASAGDDAIVARLGEGGLTGPAYADPFARTDGGRLGAAEGALPIYRQASLIFGLDGTPAQRFLGGDETPDDGSGSSVAAKDADDPEDADDVDGADTPTLGQMAGASPAERLGLDGRRRARAEKCLAEAVYFESRGEPERGQIAVAQVVMNRVFSGYYPADVCRAVYQNARRKFACQFTFACDNIRDVVTEPRLWKQAERIAADMLDGKLWDTRVGRATHYHARSVRPFWIREMRKLDRIGEHTFYRPRRWTS